MTKNYLMISVTFLVLFITGCGKNENLAGDIKENKSSSLESYQQINISEVNGKEPLSSTNEKQNKPSELINQEKAEYKEKIKSNYQSKNITVNNSNKLSLDDELTEKEIAERFDTTQFLMRSFDINADGIDDFLISRINDIDNLFQGDELFVLMGNKRGKYTVSLKASNQTDETGWFLDDIQPRSNRAGFIVNIVYSPKGRSNHTFYYELINDTWFLSKYVSSGTLVSGKDYYCVETEKSELPNVDYGSSHDFTENEFKQYCPPLPVKYTVTSDKAEILTEDFKHRNPPNYYIKNDSVKAIDQNEDWVRVSYKNGTRFGWINKEDVAANE